MILAIFAAVIAQGTAFTCTPTAVWDGDGPIWCAEGPKIRLAGIAAREIDGVCKPGHPCPDASGEAARDNLVRLIGQPVGRNSHGHVLVKGPPLQCVSEGSGKGERTAAWCSSPTNGDLSCGQVKANVAVRWQRYGGDKVCR